MKPSATLAFLLLAVPAASALAAVSLDHAPARRVIGGDLIYSAVSGAASEREALFRAESQAIRMITIECSIPLRGIRIYRQQSEQDGSRFRALVEAGIPLPDCEEARRASPERKRELTQPLLSASQKAYERMLEESDSELETGGPDAPSAAPRPHQMISDNRLRTEVLAAVANDPAIDPFQFRYVVNDGGVEVRGEASERQKDRIGESVRRVRGVTGVQNQVRINEAGDDASDLSEMERWHPGSGVENPSDEKLERDVLDAIERDPKADIAKISVQVASGQVALTGLVPNLRTRLEMRSTAEKIAGARHVTDLLEVRSHGGRSNENLERDARGALSLEPLLHAENLKVRASSGVIEISGVVSSGWKKQRASELVSGIWGTTGIQNLLKVAEFPSGKSAAARSGGL